MADATKRILFEAVLDDKGVLTGFKQIKTGLEGTQTSLASFTATARTAQTGLQNLAREGVGQLTTALAGVAGLAAMSRFLIDGTAHAMEQARALSQLSNIVEQFGGVGRTAAEATKRLADNLLAIGIDNNQTIRAVRDLTVQTHDYEAAISAASLAADMFARTGKDYATSLGIIQDLIAGKTRAVIRANLEFGTSATTAQGALDALEKQNRGFGASLDDNLQKIESSKARLQEFAETIGGPLSDALVFFIQMWKGLGTIAAGVGLVIVQAASGAVAAFQSLRALLPGGGGLAVSEAIKADWLATSKAQWEGLGKSIENLFNGTGIKPENFKRLVVDPTKAAGEAAKALKDQIEAAIKAQDKYLEGQAKVTEASFEIMKSVGSLMTETLADEFSARFAAGGDFRLKTDRAFSDFAQYAGKNIGLVMGTAAGDEFSDAMWEAARANATAGRFADVADYFGGGRAATKAGKEFSLNFGNAFREGFLTIFQGEGMVNAWKAIARGFAGIFAQSMGNMIEALFKGKPITGQGGVLEAGGLWTTDPTTGEQSFNWKGAAGMFGGALASYGMAQQNRSLAAVGGAISGGIGGGMVGGAIAGSAGGWNWVGAIVGALVGGALAYFSSGGPKQYGFNIDMGRRVGGAPLVEMGGGTGLIQEREMGRQLQTRYEEITGSFRDLLDKMNVSFDKLPLILDKWVGKSADLNATFQAILKGELPRAIAEAYLPLLQTGMTGLGVSGGRATYELGKLMTGDFDKALAALQAYIGAVLRLQDFHEDLAKSLDELETELTASVHDAWKTAADKSLEEIARLSKGLDSLTSEEQVARANQIADLAEAQYKANLQYLQNLYQMQQQMNDSFNQMFLGFEEQKAKGGGAESLGAFYQRQLADLAEQLKATTSPEMLQQIVAQMQKYGTALWQLNLPGIYGSGGKTGWGEEPVGSQAWVEQFLKDQQAAADALLKGWQEEVKAQNDALLAALAAIGDALTAETVLRQGITKSLGDEEVVRKRLKGVLDQETDAHSALTAAALAAADALAGLGGGGGVEPGARRAA